MKNCNPKLCNRMCKDYWYCKGGVDTLFDMRRQGEDNEFRTTGKRRGKEVRRMG